MHGGAFIQVQELIVKMTLLENKVRQLKSTAVTTTNRPTNNTEAIVGSVLHIIQEDSDSISSRNANEVLSKLLWLVVTLLVTAVANIELI